MRNPFRGKRSSEASKDKESSHSPHIHRLILSLLYLLATILLILVEIGNINSKPGIRSTYFFRIDLSNIVPQSIPNAVLVNSVARSIGLHDFYQVGLWGFCEGYNDQGITSCSKPKTLYAFNPVQILLNELLAGATIALPSDINRALHIVRVASQWMFACFLVGTIFTFLCIFIAPLGPSSHPHYYHRGRRILLRSVPLSIFTFLALFFTAAGSVVATVMFTIFRNIITSQSELQIDASLGQMMLGFMWTAVGLDLIGFLDQVGMCCGVLCCSGRRKRIKEKQVQEKRNG
ncbi:MAG: hypothetical protein Q9160_005201 [Pyrenula sp. 1 TL-2023]